MIDFKKLSDVEVVAEPIESANVLIEEDGVIKKTPSSSFAGGGVLSVIRIVDHELEIDGEMCPTKQTYVGDQIHRIYNTEWKNRLIAALNKPHITCSVTYRDDGTKVQYVVANCDELVPPPGYELAYVDYGSDGRTLQVFDDQ
jgi:hypothetical protein